MGATKIPDATNEKILTLVTMGMTLVKAAEACGVSDSYCGKLVEVTRCIANEDWDALIACSKARTTGNVQKWACRYLNKQIPVYVLDKIERARYSPDEKPEPTAEPIDNTADELEELFRRLGFEIDESEDGKYFDGEAFLERMKKTDRYFAMKNDIEIPRRRRCTVVVTWNRRTDNGDKTDL